jgi:NAD(P)-dependent dehydrogenase (short-subunit alcohol dehydrogenase family)
MEFDVRTPPSQRGRAAVVTGGNSGIGFEAAVALAAAGAEVVLACRDPERAEGALAELSRRVPDGRARALRLDLADLRSIEAFAREVEATYERLDLLIANAGVMGLPKGETKDGFELHLGTNHLGHFALATRLLPLLERGGASRVVTVSSMTHRYGALDLDDLGYDRRPYSSADAYAASKLANLLFAYELDRRLRRDHRRTLSMACHPGFAATQITQGTSLSRRAPSIAKVLVWGNALVAQPAHMGAWPTLHAALAPIPSGSYVGPSRVFGTRGAPAPLRSSPASYDEEAAARLWEVSEALTGARLALSSA